MQLPPAFIEQTRRLMAPELFERYLKAFDDEPPVSIRLNPRKSAGLHVAGGERVPWCSDGWYLPRRPNFTMDPLLHAGCYYVQEASSMFLDEVLRQVAPLLSPIGNCLDLCAAPGGKSTLLRSRLPAEATLYSNEPNRQRASILAENVAKWGYDRHVVTNLYPRDYRKSGVTFDLILCDVPCSGEGMFRKDPATIGEWSPQQVDRCAALQRDIVGDAWACLRPGGILIYSTCTFNIKENEENIRWLLSEYDAEALTVATRPEWGVTGSLLEGFAQPVYRFVPGTTRGEGLFLCVVRKAGDAPTPPRSTATRGKGGRLAALPRLFPPPSSATVSPTRDTAPSPKTAAVAPTPQVDVDYATAVSYLRREALTLPPDTPRGLVEVCFQGHALGLAKNIGPRANNLYPKEWRIKTTHLADSYEPVLTRDL